MNQLELNKREKLRIEKPYVYNKIIKFDEKIARGESVAIIQFQYGYQCNMRCKHCCTSHMKKKKRFFTIPDVKDLARQADELGLANFTVTGGEPLLFPDLDELIKAINPDKFFISLDSNGWLLDEAMAKHLKDIGVAKVHLSLDSLFPEIHDLFRRKLGSHEKVLKAIDALKYVGIPVLLNTVVTKQRVWSKEFVDFLEVTKLHDIPVIILLAKPCGDWRGRTDILLDDKDLAHIRELENKYNAFTHLKPSYGMDLGCIAMKRLLSITRYGDVMPCPWIQISMGNVFEEPLKDILKRGMKVHFFGKRQDTCLSSVDGEFLRDYMPKGKTFPVSWREVFKKGDFIK